MIMEWTMIGVFISASAALTGFLGFLMNYLLKKGRNAEKLVTMEKTLEVVVSELKEHGKALSASNATLTMVVSELKEQRREMSEQRKEFAEAISVINDKFEKEMAMQRKEMAASNEKIAATLATINEKVKRNTQDIRELKNELVYA